VKKIALVLLVLTLLAALVSACAEQTTATATIVDDLGRPVNIEDIPQRIVSLAPSITEILFALDLGDRVVGVTDYCDYPQEAQDKPKVGGYFTTSLELIITQEPDIVLADGHDPVDQQLVNLGLTMVVLQPKDIFGVFRNIKLVGEITGKEKEAEELIANLEARLYTVAEKTSQTSEKPRVFYEIDASDPTKPWTTGAGSFIYALITLAGAENIVEASGDWIQLSLEKLIAADPDIIILGDYPYVSPEDVKQRPGAWQQLSAVTKEEIYAISDPSLTSRPGPRIIDGLEELARIIHPELFE
jgi:iron complex transport system substrate-binding protein